MLAFSFKDIIYDVEKKSIRKMMVTAIIINFSPHMPRLNQINNWGPRVYCTRQD